MVDKRHGHYRDAVSKSRVQVRCIAEVGSADTKVLEFELARQDIGFSEPPSFTLRASPH